MVRRVDGDHPVREHRDQLGHDVRRQDSHHDLLPRVPQLHLHDQRSAGHGGQDVVRAFHGLQQPFRKLRPVGHLQAAPFRQRRGRHQRVRQVQDLLGIPVDPPVLVHQHGHRAQRQPAQDRNTGIVQHTQPLFSGKQKHLQSGPPSLRVAIQSMQSFSFCGYFTFCPPPLSRQVQETDRSPPVRSPL